jgi:hypothetical protein
VVLPNHIKKFIRATRPRVPQTLDKNLNGASKIPREIRISLIGPPSENNVKKSMENADAIFHDREIDALKKPKRKKLFGIF